MHLQVETLVAADAYFRSRRLLLGIVYEEKQTILESNKQNTLTALKARYKSQLIELKQQIIHKKESLKTGS